MTALHPRLRPIDVLVNSAQMCTVRVEQPFTALQQLGWDVRLHALPFHLERCVRPGALVIWQRPLPTSVQQWQTAVAWLRQQGCLVLVEWDDHPDLFLDAMRERFAAVDHIHLRCCHGVQTSSVPLAQVLRRFNPHVFVVDNGVQPLPPLRSRHQGNGRIFLGNLNREHEQAQLAGQLRDWMQQPDGPQLVTVGPSGVEGVVPTERLEPHPPLAYNAYRRLLASCDVALLPLRQGEPQACKTPIKWMEAAAESVAVVAGPELYGPWMEQGRYGLWAERLDAMVPLARQLMAEPAWRHALVARAHARMAAFELSALLPWRMALYHHLDRFAEGLEQRLQQRYPVGGGWAT